MKFLSFKKVPGGQSDIHITTEYVFMFLQSTVRSKKIDVRLNKTLKLKLLFDSIYRTRPSDTVTKYRIYPLSHRWKDYSNGLGSYFATLSYY